MLQHSFDSFIQQAEIERGLSFQTLQSYRQSFRLYLKFYNNSNDSLAVLNSEFIRNFFHFGKQKRAWSARTYHIHHNNLKVFCNWLVMSGYLKCNPLDNILKPKLEKPIMHSLRERDVHKILYCALFRSSQSHFLRCRNHALLMLPLHTGLRLNEVLSLKITDIRFDENTLHVRCGKGAKDRLVVMTQDLVSVLHSYLTEHEKYFSLRPLLLFPSRSGKFLTPREFRRIIAKIIEASCVRFSAHDLRRTYATRLSEKNISPFILQQQLGHSDIRVTMRYVCHHREEIRKVMDGVSLY